MNSPEISFIIVSWNAREYLRRCLNSLCSGVHGGLTETIVVDNCSTDGSPAMVSQEFPWVTLIQTGDNLGFAKGNNIGITASRGRYLCLVNSDVEVFPDTISTLRRLIEEDLRIGMLGPKVLNSDGTVQSNCRDHPTIWNTLCRAFSLDTIFPQLALFRDGLAIFPKGNSPVDVDVLTGCFWFLRREALQSVGKLDERFFMYGEDLDWCKRFHQAGWSVQQIPEARIVHHGGASSAEAPLRFFIEMHRAQLQYWRKYHSTASSLVYLVILYVHNILRVIGYSLSYLAQPGRRTTARDKMNRSWRCLKWLVAEGYRCCFEGALKHCQSMDLETPIEPLPPNLSAENSALEN